MTYSNDLVCFCPLLQEEPSVAYNYPHPCNVAVQYPIYPDISSLESHLADALFPLPFQNLDFFSTAQEYLCTLENGLVEGSDFMAFALLILFKTF